MASPLPLETASLAKPFETKRAAVSVSNISKSGSFEGYASLFNIVDLGRDLVLPGAFKESLTAHKPGSVKMLWQHDAAQVIGSWTRIVEDHKGLKVSGQLNLAVAKAREVYALMLEGAVDGLSIGFRVQQASKDPATGIRRLAKLDLWEISIVTFPMLPSARVEQVKLQPLSADARLAAAIERGTRIASETKARAEINFKLAAAINACTASLNAKLFDPAQPRDDHGRWTRGGWGGAAYVQVVQNVTSVGYSVDLAQEEGVINHTIRDHVGKSDSYLLDRTRTEAANDSFSPRYQYRAGSFTSLESATRLVNSTLSQNAAIVDEVASGARGGAQLESYFASVTGREAFKPNSRAISYMRDTYGVLVVIARNPFTAKGFDVLTSFPIH